MNTFPKNTGFLWLALTGVFSEHRASNLFPALWKAQQKHTFSAKHSLVTGEQDSPATEAVDFSKQPKDWNAKPFQAGKGKNTAL